MTLRLTERPSPNHGERTEGPVDILLLHYTNMPDDAQALAWLCNPASGVSAHYFVEQGGQVRSLVPEERRAWHAGVARWGTTGDVNSRSIGIEIANGGHRGGLPPYPDAQIEAVVALCHGILARHPIPPHRVLAHSDVAPGRKEDPGEHFPWERLAAAGVGHWVPPVPPDGDAGLREGDRGTAVADLQALLALYGYGVAPSGDYDTPTALAVTAFQRHFRPGQIDGIADRSTVETLAALIEALP